MNVDFDFLKSEFLSGVWSAVRDMTRGEARRLFAFLKESDFSLAVEFMEQFRYFIFTGRLMEAV